MEQFQDVFVLVDLFQGGGLFVPKRRVAAEDDLGEIFRRDGRGRDEQAEDAEREFGEGEVFPGFGPVRGESGDTVGNVKTAVRS